jgi:dephospho-CoA kinase
MMADNRDDENPRIVVCLTGLPGAGKSVIAEVGVKYGFETFRMGDDVRMEAEIRKIPPTDENLGAIMLELRQKNGPTAIAALCKQRIEKNSKSKYITIDGLRSIPEFQEFKKLGNARLVAVQAPPEKRFEFLRTRRRQDSPDTMESFALRDQRELSVGLAEVMAIADEVVANSGSLSDLKAKAELLFARTKKGQFQKHED